MYEKYYHTLELFLIFPLKQKFSNFCSIEGKLIIILFIFSMGVFSCALHRISTSSLSLPVSDFLGYRINIVVANFLP